MMVCAFNFNGFSFPSMFLLLTRDVTAYPTRTHSTRRRYGCQGYGPTKGRHCNLPFQSSPYIAPKDQPHAIEVGPYGLQQGVEAQSSLHLIHAILFKLETHNVFHEITHSHLTPMASRPLLLRRMSRFLKPLPVSPSFHSSSSSSIHRVQCFSVKAPEVLGLSENTHPLPRSNSSRSFCSRCLNIKDESQGPTAIDYRSLLQEDEFHRLADSTIHDLQEKFEDYGDSVEVDGFDIDYGNDVLTVKLGDVGTYVLNKQTPNRQIWLSSPVRMSLKKSNHGRPDSVFEEKRNRWSEAFQLGQTMPNNYRGLYFGPSRFDWDQDAKAWIYRRNKAKLYNVLEGELEQLCGKPIVLS